MQVSTTSDNRLEYCLFCDKHAPLKVKRVLDQKYRSYELDITNFFKQFDRFKAQINRSHKQKAIRFFSKKKQLPTQQQSVARVFKPPVFKDEEVFDFATEFTKFLASMNRESISLTFLANHIFESMYIPEIGQKSCYELRTVPKLLWHKTNSTQKAIIPFYRSSIKEDDPVWHLFRFNTFSVKQLYEIYQLCVRRASRYLSELNPLKQKQMQLFDLLTKKQKLDTKLEQKKEIHFIQQGDVVIVQDENLYCVCRKQFLEGQQMICCEDCDEWFHFECIGFKGTITSAEQVLFSCFMCFERMPAGKLKNRQIKNYKKYFIDPYFQLQKEIATAINLYDLRNKRMAEKQLAAKTQQLEEKDSGLDKLPVEEAHQDIEGNQLFSEQHSENIQVVAHEKQEQITKNGDKLEAVQEEIKEMKKFEESELVGQEVQKNIIPIGYITPKKEGSLMNSESKVKSENKNGLRQLSIEKFLKKNN